MARAESPCLLAFILIVRSRYTFLAETDILINTARVSDNFCHDRVLPRARRSDLSFISFPLSLLQKSRDRNRHSEFPRGTGGVFAPSGCRHQYLKELLVRSAVGYGRACRRRSRCCCCNPRRACATLRTRVRSRRNDLRRDRRHRPGGASEVCSIIECVAMNECWQSLSLPTISPVYPAHETRTRRAPPRAPSKKVDVRGACFETITAQ